MKSDQVGENDCNEINVPATLVAKQPKYSQKEANNLSEKQLDLEKNQSAGADIVEANVVKPQEVS